MAVHHLCVILSTQMTFFYISVLHSQVLTHTVYVDSIAGISFAACYQWKTCCVILVGGLCDLLTHEASLADKAYVHLVALSVDSCCHFISRASIYAAFLFLTSPFFFFLFISAQFIFRSVASRPFIATSKSQPRSC